MVECDPDSSSDSDDSDDDTLYCAIKKGNCVEVQSEICGKCDINKMVYYDKLTGKEHIRKICTKEMQCERIYIENMRFYDYIGGRFDPLWLAACNGNLKIMNYILSHSLKRPNDINEAFRSATLNRHFEISRYLLAEEGANVNYQNADDGNTVLHDTISYCFDEQPDIAEFLLANGADCEIRNNDGLTALLYAATKHTVQYVNLLLNNDHKKVNVNVSDPVKNKTPLFLTYYWGESCWPERDRLAIAKLLVANCPSVLHDYDLTGETILHHVADSDDCESLCFFLDNGADIEARDYRGETPIFKTINDGHVSRDTMKLLIDRGANVRAENNAGETLIDLMTRMVVYRNKYTDDKKYKMHCNLLDYIMERAA